MENGALWADWVRAAGANPNDIMLTKIAWKLKIARSEERKHIGFHHFQLSLPHYDYETYLVWNLEEVDLGNTECNAQMARSGSSNSFKI